MARKKLETLTEQLFYVLLVLRKERHGYGIMQAITALTNGGANGGDGTTYAPLERVERAGVILPTRTELNRKYYQLNPQGDKVLQDEYQRIRQQATDMEQVLREEETT